MLKDDRTMIVRIGLITHRRSDSLIETTTTDLNVELQRSRIGFTIDAGVEIERVNLSYRGEEPLGKSGAGRSLAHVKRR